MSQSHCQSLFHQRNTITMLINRIFITSVVVVFIISVNTVHACGGGGSKAPSPTVRPTSCDKHIDCRDFEQCLMSQCTDVCEYELIPHAKNAICNAKRHVPIYTCPDAYVGNPYRKCDKECTSNEGCADMDTCRNNTCVHGCDTVTCGSSEYCRSRNHTPSCATIKR